MHRKDLDKFYSDKRLGSFVENGKTYFRLFAPQAERVTLITYTKAENSTGKKYKMICDADGVWEAVIEGELFGIFYGFSVKQKHQRPDEEIVCLDPYAKAVVTLNNYLNPRKAIVVRENNYDWQDDEWIQMDWRDLVIYEMHVRDMTAHKTAGSRNPGTYKALVDKKIKGGINYLKNLGVNAVELLPVQEFGNVEIPFKKEFIGIKNTWNPYERNHWGYMTAGFFAPDSYYSDGGKEFRQNEWTGKSGRQVNDFKDMVKEFHRNEIAVIMDVVYNHYSEYEYGGLKEIDKEYYFRLDEKGKFISQSYTGNDLKTERPMVRRMIIDSVLYWMREYHIDGFRFDLGHLIDWQTIEEITEEAQKINPDVILICEPWGGGYDPAGFSIRGWASWNDQVRNGVKGENPFNGKGWIFQNWFGDNDTARLKSYINGTLICDRHGLFQKKEHSVNYLESHDGYTFGDFIRLATGDVKKDQVIKDINENAKLSAQQMKLNKLGALFLFCCQGIIMIHEGQEYARSKIISSNPKADDPDKGKLDHNSYNKDNETNYLNYNHAELNKELVNYYKGLIALRKKYSAFRRAEYQNIRFIEILRNPFAIAFNVIHKGEKFFIAINADSQGELKLTLPEENWQIIVNDKKSGVKKLGQVKNEIVVPAVSGIVLRKN